MTRAVRALVAAGLGLAAIAGPLGTAPAAVAAGHGPGVPRASASADSTQCSDGVGAHIDQSPPALAQLQAQLAWGVTQGAGVVVAVVDSGVDASNPHFAGALAGGVDLVGDGKGQSGYADLDGHGTAVAGQIAARPIDGSGVIGLAPAARILSVRIFSTSDGSAQNDGTGPTIPRIAEGIRVAADAHAQIINVSLSTAEDDPSLRSAVAYATAHGSLVVASSGNTDSTLSVEKDGDLGARYPAGDPGAIGVAAVTSAGDATAASVHGPHVSAAAPGQSILTAARAGIDCVYAGDSPASSFASAYVSAAAALVAAAHPDETPAEWAYRLEATAVRPHAGARDDDTGWGVVQPYEAITLVPGSGVAGPPSPFGDAGGTRRPDAGDVALHHRIPADTNATTIAILAAIGAGVVLGVFVIVAVLLRRRRDTGRVADPLLDDGREFMGRVTRD